MECLLVMDTENFCQGQDFSALSTNTHYSINSRLGQNGPLVLLY